jgi:hypothetical protein
MGKFNLRHVLGLLGWRLYVWGYWCDNKDMQSLLDKETAENLGYFLNNHNELEARHSMPIQTEELW